MLQYSIKNDFHICYMHRDIYSITWLDLFVYVMSQYVSLTVRTHSSSNPNVSMHCTHSPLASYITKFHDYICI